MLCVENLAKLELFQHLPPARLDWVCGGDRYRRVDIRLMIQYMYYLNP
jgi:hypothetical protein